MLALFSHMESLSVYQSVRSPNLIDQQRISATLCYIAPYQIDRTQHKRQQADIDISLLSSCILL